MNKAEIIRAIEYYLNGIQFKEPVAVSNVVEDKGDNIFNITLEDDALSK